MAVQVRQPIQISMDDCGHLSNAMTGLSDKRLVQDGFDVKSDAGPQRTRLAVLFADLSDSTRLSQSLDPEEYLDIINAVRAIWRDVAERTGGLMVRSQGDGTLMVFGYPVVAEDDAVRAVEAALQIQERVSQLQFPGLPEEMTPLATHSGVHAGIVLVAPGDMERGNLDLTGEIVNRAAHLSAAAGRGQVLVSLPALGPYANFFDAAAASAHQCARAGTPDICVVQQRNRLSRRYESMSRRGLTPLIARDKALSKLLQYMRSGRASERAQCMMVVGPAGMGKTRLIEESLRHFQPSTVLVLRGGCESYLGARILQPFMQMVAYCLAALALPGDAGMPTFGHDGGQRLRARLERADASWARGEINQVGEALAELVAIFGELSQLQPVVMMIEDWQWADDASLRLLHMLMHASCGPTIVLASRPTHSDGMPRTHTAAIELEPLSLDEAYQAMARWVPQVDPFLAERIYGYSGGNPLLIEELCHSASIHSLSRLVDGRASNDGWLQNLIAARLTVLSPTALETLQICAAVGRETPRWLLQAVLGDAPGREDIGSLQNADLLYTAAGDNVLRFKHILTQKAVYQQIGLTRRKALHARVLDILLSSGRRDQSMVSAQTLAYQSQAAGRWQDAASFAEAAGDLALQAHALDRAREQYSTALEALERQAGLSGEYAQRWCGLAAKMAMASVFDPLSLGCDVSKFEKALALARQSGEQQQIVRALYWLAYMCYSIGQARRAQSLSREARALTDDGASPWLAAQLDALHGKILCATCHYDEAFIHIDKAVSAMHRQARTRESLALGAAYVLACRGGAEADRGQFAAARTCFEQSLELLEDSVHPLGNSVRNWVAVGHNWQGNWTEALRVASDSVRIAENTRALLLLSAARCSQAYATWAPEALPQAGQQLTQAMHWADQRGGRLNAAIYHGWLAAIAATYNCPDDVRHHAAVALARARAGERMGEAVACRSLAWMYAQAGREGAALRWLQRAGEAARRRQSIREERLNDLLHGQLALWNGRTTEALSALDRAAHGFDRLGMQWHCAVVERMIHQRDVPRVILN